MVRKIKIVNINENKTIETINQSEIGNVILNDGEHYVSDPEVLHNTSSSSNEEEVVPILVKEKKTRVKHIDIDTVDPKSLQDLAN